MKRVFEPTSKFCKGTRIETRVKHWIWTKGRGLWVVYKDGIKCKSEYTLKELPLIESVREVK